MLRAPPRATAYEDCELYSATIVLAATPLSAKLSNLPAQVMTSCACRMDPRAEILAFAIATLTKIQSLCVSTVDETTVADASNGAK